MKTHPIHPAIVHFPIACWSLAVLADFASLIYGQSAWQWSGGLLIMGGLTGLLAALAGGWDLRSIPEGQAMRDAIWHLGLMLTAWTLFVLRLLVGVSHLAFIAPHFAALFLDVLGFTCLMLGGWMGARLVYTHGIGQTRARGQRHHSEPVAAKPQQSNSK